MTADVTREPTGGQGLREAVARGLESLPSVRVNANRPGEVPGYWTGRLTPPETTHLADAVLALPELAALIADADNWRRATTGDPTEPEPLAMQARDLLVAIKRVRALADEIDSHHAPYCCTVACPEPDGRHGDPTDPVRIQELVGILGDNPPPLIEHRRLPCPGTCTCPAGADAARLRRALDGEPQP